jgi:hypothetical protein
VTTPQPYGIPTPPPYGAPQPKRGLYAGPTGRALLTASWRMLRQDSELVWLPVLGSIFGLIAAGILFVPGWFLGDALGGSAHHSWAAWIGGVLAAFGASIVSIFFQAALVAGANERADGGDPTLGSAVAAAWARRGRILSWAVLTTTVGMAIRTVERRLGILGNLVGILAGLAWAIATFLVVPVLVSEDLGPVDAVKRSADLIKSNWGTSLRTTLRFGFIQFVVTVPAILLGVIGIALATGGSGGRVAVGVVLILVAVVALVAMVMVFSAIGSYARALIYRYATGRPVPGVDAALFAGVFRPKRS